MANTSSTSTVHIVLNIISITATIIGTLLSFTVLAGVLLRRKTFHNAQLILCMNKYILVFLFGIFELMHGVTILRGDFGLMVDEAETVECRIRAYILFSLISAVYLACVLQAIFRLCRIVYPTYLWLVDSRTYLIIIPLIWTFSFVLVSPLYIWHGQILISGENVCRIPKDDAFSIAYSTLAIYGIPFNILAFVYFQLHRFLRRQAASVNSILAFSSRRRQRDVRVLSRIIILVTLLGSYGVPNCVMLIMLAITHELVPSFYRILEMSFAACILTLSMAPLYVDPQLRKEIKICRRKTKVINSSSDAVNLERQPFDLTQLRTATYAPSRTN